MSVDWTHTLASMVVIAIVILALQRVPRYRAGTRGQRFVMLAVLLFVALTGLNLLLAASS